MKSVDKLPIPKITRYPWSFVRLYSLLFLLVPTLAFASEPTVTELDGVLAALIDLQQTEIATKTAPTDADIAPGTVLVLQGEILRQFGFRNVAEALSLVPGIRFSGGMNELPSVRGVGGILATGSGKLKLMVNGAPANDVFTGLGRTVFAINTAQIDRIEVIRGPGSAVHGEFALSGVINIITKADANELNVAVGDGDTFSVGGVLQHTWNEGIKASLNLQHNTSKGIEVISGDDIVTSVFAQPESSNAPGRPNKTSVSTDAVMRMSYENTELQLQWMNLGVGSGFGTLSALPKDTDNIVLEEQWLMARVNGSIGESSAMALRWHINATNFERIVTNNEGFPPGFLGLYPDGTSADSNEKINSHGLGMEFLWLQSDSHKFSSGFDIQNMSSGDAYVKTNLDLNVSLPGLPFNPPLQVKALYELGYGHRTRKINSVFIQDELALFDVVNITMGLRYSDYSDVESETSPRLALVITPSDHHILKFNYAEAFRPPTFIELYNVVSVYRGNSELRPETIETLELGYIYKAERLRLGLTLFQSNYHNLIGLSDGRFNNFDKVASEGIEFDWQVPISTQLKLNGYLTYTDARDSQGKKLTASSNWYGSGGIMYQMRPDIIAALLFSYESDRYRSPTDMRSPLAGNHTLNLTLNWNNLFRKNLYMRLGIFNLLDASTSQPAPERTYPYDYPGPGRNYWLSFEKRF